MTRATISIRHVLSIVELVGRQGFETDLVLARANIAPSLLQSKLSRITQQQFSALIRAVVRVTRDEFWGIGTRKIVPGSLAAVCRLVVEKRTLGEALRAGFHHYHLLTPDLTARLSVRGSLAHIRIADRVEDPLSRRLLEATFVFFLYGLICWYCGRRVPLAGIDMSFSKAHTSEDAGRAFRIDIGYGRERCEIRFDARYLKFAGVQDRDSVEAFLRLCPGVLGVGFRDESSTTERVRRLLRRNVRTPIDLEDVAGKLAISPPTLRRRLAAEGHNFQGLKDAVRRDAAIEELQRRDGTMEQIAALLGFSEVSTFHRAFKKWTGSAPGDYRRSRI